LVQAEKYYTQALEINPEYSRAYIGLASVIHYRATNLGQRTGNLTDFDWPALEEEKNILKMALKATDKPPSADIVEKVSFIQAQLELAIYTQDFLVEHIDKAKDSYQYVIAHMEKKVIIDCRN